MDNERRYCSSVPSFGIIGFDNEPNADVLLNSKLDIAGYTISYVSVASAFTQYVNPSCRSIRLHSVLFFFHCYSEFILDNLAQRHKIIQPLLQSIHSRLSILACNQNPSSSVYIPYVCIRRFNFGSVGCGIEYPQNSTSGLQN
jgi:hypothetical protein